MKKQGRPPVPHDMDWVSFFDAVDEVRRKRMFVPLKKLYSKSRRTLERALLNATARALAHELNTDEPWWAMKANVLDKPYFVSGVENLKASALIESPVEFKQNNIFVLGNFLKRV